VSFIKWLGGKVRFRKEIVDEMPENVGDYYEPFVGAGSVFFELVKRERIKGTAHLSDANQCLVYAWQAVRDAPHEVQAYLEARPETREEFMRVRAQDKHTLSPIERGSRLIWLTNCAYGGAWRETKDGQFSGTWSPSPASRPRIPYRVKTVFAAHEALKRVNVKIACKPFDLALSRVRSGALVYCDPPYIDACAAHEYVAGAYGPDHQRALYARLRELRGEGASVFVSEADGAPIASCAAWRTVQRFEPKRNGMKGRDSQGVFATEFRDALYAVK